VPEDVRRPAHGVGDLGGRLEPVLLRRRRKGSGGGVGRRLCSAGRRGNGERICHRVSTSGCSVER
jgi:hypothetical protein